MRVLVLIFDFKSYLSNETRTRDYTRVDASFVFCLVLMLMAEFE